VAVIAMPGSKVASRPQMRLVSARPIVGLASESPTSAASSALRSAGVSQPNVVARAIICERRGTAAVARVAAR
jgi:hypothetical protein